MGRYLGDDTSIAVKLPCAAPANDDVFTVDPTNPNVGIWKKAGTSNIADLAITTGKLGALAVDDTKIAAGAVTEAKLGAGSVTEAKVGAGAVTEAKIGSGAITNAKVAAGAGIDGSKMSTTFTLPGTLQVQAAFTLTPPNLTGLPYSAVFDEATVNYILNPSFEVNVTDGWTAVGTATLSRTTATGEFHWGVAACKVDVPTGAARHGLKHSNIAAVATDVWVFSAFVRVRTGTKTINLRIEYLNSGLSVIQTQDVPWLIGTSFVRAVSYSTAPANTAWIRCSIDNDGANQGAFDFQVDGVQAEKNTGTEPTSYCEGGFGGPGYAWSGTAHNSTSSRSSGLQIIQPESSNGLPAWIETDGTVHVGQEIEVGNSENYLRIIKSGLQAEGLGAAQSLLLNCKGNSSVAIGRTGSTLGIMGAGSSSFPASPTTNSLFFRTDHGVLYYYDGANWVSAVAATLCSFNAYRSAAFSTSVPGGYTLIQYDTEVFDLGADFATGASAGFTAPFAGLYQFSASGGPSAGVTTEQYAIGLFVNGVQNNTGNIVRQGAAGDATSIVSTTLKLAASDVVTARLFSPTNRAMAVGKSFNWFSGHCVAVLG